MNVFMFALAAWICFGLDTALPPVLDAGSGGVHPSFIMPLLVFVALHADGRVSLWSAIVLGLITDLLSPATMVGGGDLVIVGPNALGFALAAQLVHAARGVVIRHNPLTMVVLSMIAAFAASLTVVAIMGIRTAFDDSVPWGGVGDLGVGLWSALYTGLGALAMSIPLFAAAPLFGFAHPQAQRFSRRD